MVEQPTYFQAPTYMKHLESDIFAVLTDIPNSYECTLLLQGVMTNSAQGSSQKIRKDPRNKNQGFNIQKGAPQLIAELCCKVFH